MSNPTPAPEEELDNILQRVRDAGAQDYDDGGLDWTNSDRAIDKAAHQILAYVDKRERRLLDEIKSLVINAGNKGSPLTLYEAYKATGDEEQVYDRISVTQLLPILDARISALTNSKGGGDV